MQHKQKSRTYAKRKVRTTTGRAAVHYQKRKPSKPVCALCGKKLKAVPREQPGKMHNLPKTKKRPERPYGGVLCSACMREKLKSTVRTL